MRTELCQNGLTRGRARERWILFDLIAEKHCWGSKALLQLLCWIQAMQCIGSTEAPKLSKTRPSGVVKRQAWVGESQLPPLLSALWQIVDIGWGNSLQAKEEATTGSWQWGEFKGAQNWVLCLSWDVIMPKSLQTNGALYPSWPANWADCLMMLGSD